MRMRDRSEEYFIGTKYGVRKVRTIRRHGIQDKQWDVKVLHEFQGVPWEPIPGREGIEVRANIELPMEETEPTPVQEPEPTDVIR